MSEKPQNKKQNVKKDEETKKPQTSQGQRSNQKSRGNQNRSRGGANKQQDSENTRDGQQNRGGNRNNNRQREQDKDSWIYKFHHMDRPKWERIQFTPETEIPALPDKADRLKQPQKTEFDQKMAAIDAEINKIRDHVKSLHSKRREVIDGGKIKGSN